MRSLTDLSCSAASREASINMRSVTLSGMRSVFFKSLAKSGSSFISCYDALIRACLEERAIAIVTEWSGVNRRPGTDVGAVDIAQAVAANAAKFTMTTGVCREHFQTLSDANGASPRTNDQLVFSFNSSSDTPVAAKTSGHFSAGTRPDASQCSIC